MTCNPCTPAALYSEMDGCAFHGGRTLVGREGEETVHVKCDHKEAKLFVYWLKNHQDLEGGNEKVHSGKTPARK